MKLSVIVPAFNEEKRLGACLRHIREALAASTDPFPGTELIVVDNNSTDATPKIAAEAGARVIFEPVNHIARARNAGGNAATGDWLLFVDADTHISAATLGEIADVMRDGRYIGGGTILKFDATPLFWTTFVFLANQLVIRPLRWTPGCLVFCRADVFKALGGFDLCYYAGEDAEFGKAMKRHARAIGKTTFILHRHPPVTSSRKLELYGLGEVLSLITRFLLMPQRTMRDKSRLHVFYDGRR